MSKVIQNIRVGPIINEDLDVLNGPCDGRLVEGSLLPRIWIPNPGPNPDQGSDRVLLSRHPSGQVQSGLVLIPPIPIVDLDTIFQKDGKDVRELGQQLSGSGLQRVRREIDDEFVQCCVVLWSISAQVSDVETLLDKGVHLDAIEILESCLKGQNEVSLGRR